MSAAIGGISNASSDYFGFYLAASGAYGYMVVLPVFLPVMLLLRHFRRDDLMLCVLLGFATGIIFYVAVLGARLSGDTFLSLAVDAALPFAFMLGAVRLIAGPRT